MRFIEVLESGAASIGAVKAIEWAWKLYDDRRKRQAESAQAEVARTVGMAQVAAMDRQSVDTLVVGLIKAVQKDATNLRADIATIRAEWEADTAQHKADIAEIEARYKSELAARDAKIAELVEELNRAIEHVKTIQAENDTMRAALKRQQEMEAELAQLRADKDLLQQGYEYEINEHSGGALAESRAEEAAERVKRPQEPGR